MISIFYLQRLPKFQKECLCCFIMEAFVSERCISRSVITISNLNILMHCHCGTNNRAPRWTFTNPCKPKVRPGAREESASPAWLAAPAMNACDTTKVYIWKPDTGCGPTPHRKYHSHNTSGKNYKRCVEFQTRDLHKVVYKILLYLLKSTTWTTRTFRVFRLYRLYVQM